MPNAPKTFADLAKPEYKGQVALNGDPRTSGSGFAAVMAASLANGGSADDILPGIQFFADLKASGNLIPVSVDQSTVISGETPIAIDWSYNWPGLRKQIEDAGYSVEINFPADGVYGGFYSQGVVKNSPHQACAKLWIEHIVSNEGALGYLGGGAMPGPVRGARGRRSHRRRRQGRVAAGRPARPGELPVPGTDRRGHGGARSQLGPDGGRRLIGALRPIARCTLDGGRADGTVPAARRLSRITPWAGLLPFLAFLFLFLLLPAYGVVKKAFTDTGGGFTTSTFFDVIGDERQAFVGSFKISFVTAGLGVAIGTAVAYAAATATRPRWLRPLVSAFSGVAANMGGVVLAFLFFTLLGRQGLGTKLVREGVGVDLYNTSWFDISSFWGWATVYMYFQIPLMVLVDAAGDRRTQAGLARSVLEPRWHHVDVLATGRAAGARTIDARRVPPLVRQRVQRLRHRLRAQQPGQRRAGQDQLRPHGRRRRPHLRAVTRSQHG